MAQQQQPIHKFVLGTKELDGKSAEFGYDKGWYSITDIVGEEREVIYKSRNAQEAYMKWNVYIGRKKERPLQDERRKSEQGDGSEPSAEHGSRQERNHRRSGESHREKEQGRSGMQGGREAHGENRGNRDRNRNRGNRDSARTERTGREDQSNREARRDRRRNRSDRSRRDREYTEQE